MEKSGPCIHGEPRHRLIAPAKELVDLPFQIRQGTGGHRPARIDHDIPRRSQFCKPAAYHFADAPPEAIAGNGFPDSPGRSEPDAGPGADSGQAESRKERPVVTEAVVVNFAEFAGS